MVCSNTPLRVNATLSGLWITEKISEYYEMVHLKLNPQSVRHQTGAAVILISRRVSVSAIAIVLFACGWQSIAEARDLFQFVDQDAVACLHARQLDVQLQRLCDSEFGTRLKRASFFQDWVNSPDYQQLGVVKVAVQAASGKPLEQSRQELFSEDVVLAWYHTPGTKTDLARNCVLLIEVESPAAAKSALAAWNVLERQRTEAHKYREVDYTHSVKASADENAKGFWYAILGDVLVMSIREDRIQRTIELATEATDDSEQPSKATGKTTGKTTGHPECLSVYEPFSNAFARRHESELAAVYVNPRVLISELGRANKDFPPVKATLARCQWLTLSLTNNESIELNLLADYDSNGTPDWWQDWLQVAKSARPSFKSLSADSLFAMSGQIASPSIAKLILASLKTQSNLPKDLIQARRVAQGLLLGLDPVADVLPAIGPSWVFSVQSRDPEVSTSFPVDSLFAIDVKTEATEEASENGETRVSAEAALESSLRSGLGVLAGIHNVHAIGQNVSIVKERKVGAATIYFANPVAFFQPAFVISDGQLVLATSPDLCETFLALTANGETSTASRSGNLQSVVASSVATRQMLADQREWFIRQARRDKVSEADAERRLKELEQFLQLLDRAWMTASLDSRTLRVSAGIQAAASERPGVVK